MTIVKSGLFLTLMLTGAASLAATSTGCNNTNEPLSTPVLPGFERLPADERLSVVTPSGRSFQYEIILPPNYSHAEAHKVLFAFHGGGSSGRRNKLNSSFPGISEALDRDYILVFPISTESSTWNYARDIEAIETIVDTIKQNYCVEESQFFATGHSAGSFFIYDVALLSPELFRAYAPVSGALSIIEVLPLVEDRFNAGTPIQVPAMMMTHSPNDAIIRPARFYDSYMEICKLAQCQFTDGLLYGQPFQPSPIVDENGLEIERQNNSRVRAGFVERILEPFITDIEVVDDNGLYAVNDPLTEPEFLTCQNIEAEISTISLCIYSRSVNAEAGMIDPHAHQPTPGVYETSVVFFDGFAITDAENGTGLANQRTTATEVANYSTFDGQINSTPNFDVLLSLSNGSIDDGTTLVESSNEENPVAQEDPEEPNNQTDSNNPQQPEPTPIPAMCSLVCEVNGQILSGDITGEISQ